VSQQVLLTFFAANSIREILRKFGISATVKWPNDVFVGTKKIAGILIENSVTNQFITSSILGIGLNVNQLEFEGLNATSLQLETGVFHQRNELLFMLLNQLSKNWELVLENSPKLKEDFIDNLFRINKRSKFQKETSFFYGIIRGIDKNGLLLIEVDGSLISFDLKEIKFVL
jgi:BirA family biotin operon repressor/biotin-[acetyl-CoA-carboxylase] ligase